MRADRLVAALLVLQARGRVTAADLARELEVSERTARRDLEALAMSGVPVYSLPGRGGGWELVGGARTDLSGLTADEARALFLLAGPEAATKEVRAALRKLVRALPATFRAGAEAAAAAVVRDPAGWDHAEPPAPVHLEVLQRAVIDGVQVELGYRGRDGRASQRRVHPLGLVVKNDVWYLVADTEAGQRTFRVSRVRAAELTDAAVRRPPGFDLGEAWRSIVTTVDAQRAPLVVRLRTDARILDVLQWLFGNRVAAGAPDRAGRVEVELRANSELMVARQLAGFGDAVEVLSPDAVRGHLADIGRGLLSRNAGSNSRAGADAAVAGGEPVATPVAGGRHGVDRLVEPDVSGRAAEGCVVADHSAVAADEPVALGGGIDRHPHDGRVQVQVGRIALEHAVAGEQVHLSVRSDEIHALAARREGPAHDVVHVETEDGEVAELRRVEVPDRPVRTDEGVTVGEGVADDAHDLVRDDAFYRKGALVIRVTEAEDDAVLIGELDPGLDGGVVELQRRPAP
jgi:predicted DNA-binding transcriptional regulator YafY